MKIPFGLAEITKLDIEHCALLSIILGFHKNNKPLFMLNKPLAKITGMSESKVRQKLKNLQSAGWIDIQLNVKNDYYFYDRLITFKKDVNLLEQQLEALESKLLTFDVNSDVDILLDHPIENHTPIKNSMVKTADYPIENVTPTLTKSIDPPIKNDIHIRLIDNDNKLLLDNKSSQKSKDFLHSTKETNNNAIIDFYLKEGKYNLRGNLYFKQSELETLKSKWNADKLEEYLDSLDNWLYTPKNFKLRRSHYLTVNKWLNDAYNNSLKNGFAYQVDLEWKANNNEKDYTDIDMSKQMLVEDF